MSKHILIIGGGVVGLSTAYYSARQGHRVTLVDRHPEKRDGCSFGNAGFVVPSHFVPLSAPGMIALGLKWMWNPESPFFVKPRFDLDLFSWGIKFWRAANARHVERSAPLLRDLNLASRDCFEELDDLTNNDFGLVKKGLLMLCKTQEGLEDEARTVERAKQLDMPAEVLDSKQTAALEPNIRMDVAGAVHFPQDCNLLPDRFMASLENEVRKLGVEFSWETEVTGWRQTQATTPPFSIEAVRTSKGDLEADEYVICAGSWSSVIANGLCLKLPMQAGKGYSLTLPSPRQLPQRGAILTEARVAVTPLGNALRVGGTMEIAGLNETINPVRVRGIIKSFLKYYPEFTPHDFEGIQPWCGLRPCSPDGLPYVGRARQYQNLSLATGHAMMGLSLGPITGKLIAEILSGEKPSIGIELLDPDRYG